MIFLTETELNEKAVKALDGPQKEVLLRINYI